MCLAFVAWQVHSNFPLVVAANRDEFYDRSAEPLHAWPDRPEILAGRDAGGARGTWLGLGESSRFALLTNVRERNPAKGHRSRGRLVADFLDSRCDPSDYLSRVDRSAYRGFTLVVSDLSTMWVLTNRGTQREPTQLKPGLHGFSSGVHGEALWPKVSSGIAHFGAIAEGTAEHAELRSLLADTTMDAERLSVTGMGDAIEQLLSPRFVRTSIYGTRSSTTLRVDVEAVADIVEVTHGERFGASGSTVEVRTRLDVTKPSQAAQNSA